MSEPNKPGTPSHRFIWTVTLALIAIIAALTAAIYFIIAVTPAHAVRLVGKESHDTADMYYELARKIARDVDSRWHFTPQIYVGKTIVIDRTSPTLELATVKRTFQHQFRWTNVWHGSTKVIEFEGDFEAKAGFNLKDTFTVTIDANTGAASLALPTPKILAIELRSFTMNEQTGWWNRISKAERDRVGKEFLASARAEAEKSDLPAEAKTMLELQLKNLIEKNGGHLSTQDSVLIPSQ